MYYKELWKIVRKNKSLFGGVASIVIVLSLLPLLQSLVVQEFVSSLQGGADDHVVSIVLIYVVFMFVMPSVFRQVQSYLNKVLDYVVKAHMVQFVYGKACRVPVKFFENSAQAGLLHRALDVNSSDSQTMILALADIGVQTITLAVLTVRFGWLGLGLLAISGSLTWLDECLEYRLRKMDYSFWKDREEPDRFCRVLRRLLMNKKSVSELFAYDARSVYVERLYQQQQKLDDSTRKQNKKRFWYVLFVSIIYSMRSGLLYLFIALSACCSVISVPVALGVFAIVGSYGRACSNLIQNVTNLRAQKLFCKEFEDMLALPEEETQGGDSVGKGKIAAEVHTMEEGDCMNKEQGSEEALEIRNAEVVFQEVHYRYPENDKEALVDISLRIRPGEKIALVGDNGAGKSTLIRLLLGLDEPTSGEVYLDSRGIGRKYDVNVFRKYTTIMLQNFCKYPYSVRDNIAIGGIGQEDKMDGVISMGEGISIGKGKCMGKGKAVKEIVEKLDLQEMVARMPNQLETEIISEGILSGGEWQMVALSRAYIKNGSFVILDEPTAAIDAKREIWLYRKFLDLIKARTAVIVSHRLPVCQICDRILVMQSGRIIESGTHEELLKQGGRYAEMYEQQSGMYR